MSSTVKCDLVTGESSHLTNIHNSETFHVSELDLDTFCENPVITIIGKRKSGKSMLAKSIIKHQLEKGLIDEIVVFSLTEKMNKFYENFVTDVNYKLDFGMLEKILEKQEQNIENENKKKYMIVFDDCCGTKGEWTKNAAMQEILFNGRHYNISYIFIMQFPIGISPELRSNFDYIFLFKDDVISNLKRMYDHYAGIFPSFNLFKQVFQQLTDNNSTMAIKNKGSVKSILEKIFWYKASETTFNSKIPTILKKDIFENNICGNIDGEINNFLEKHPSKKFATKKNNSKISNLFENLSIEKKFGYPSLESTPDFMLPPHFSESMPNDYMYKTPPQFWNPLQIGSMDNIQNNVMFDDTESYAEPQKKSKGTKTSKKKDEKVNNITAFYDHIKSDTTNKNKYDVLFEIVKCNSEIIKSTNVLHLNENKINAIIDCNLKIANVCCTNNSDNTSDTHSLNIGDLLLDDISEEI